MTAIGASPSGASDQAGEQALDREVHGRIGIDRHVVDVGRQETHHGTAVVQPLDREGIAVKASDNNLARMVMRYAAKPLAKRAGRNRFAKIERRLTEDDDG